MNFLLDMHAFLWFLDGNDELSPTARTCIENSGNNKFISIASIGEIAIKVNLGKLRLGVTLEDLKQEILRNGFEILPLDFDHIIGLENLDQVHKDPFDRILISQALFEDYTILSKDPNIHQYRNIKVIW